MAKTAPDVSERSSVGNVIGDSDVCVLRVQLTDAESGDMVGEAICWGSVKSALRRGSEQIGVGVGKAVALWLEKRLPDKEREKRKKDLGKDEE